MTGRHATPRASQDRSWPRRLGLSVAAMATLGAAGLAVASVVAPSDEECSGSVLAAVSADPAIAPALSEIADAYAETEPTTGGHCVQIEVNAASSDEVEPTLTTDDSPDLWVPKTELLARPGEGADLERLAEVAVSPLVVAMPRDQAEELGWPDAEYSWQSLLDSGPGILVDPASTDEGLASLLALQAALGDNVDQAELVQVMTQVAQTVHPTTETAFASTAENGGDTFTALERDVILHNREVPESPYVAVYPGEGTLAFDFPALAVRGPDTDKSVQTAVTDFVTYLDTADALETIRATGLRSPDGVPAEVAKIVEGIQAEMPDLLPEPDPAVIAGIERQWAALSLDMRMLAVIDVSGSMKEQVGDQGTRIELTRDAALEAVQLFPPSSSVGLWAFSTLRNPPDDHIELVEVGPLDDVLDDGGTRMDDLVAGLESLPDLAEGGTGLYDTVMAAFQEMRANYQPGMINSVVLLTDGRNEDDPDGVDLATLLNTLTAQFDPSAPVPVITIGMGPDADMDALRQISDATGTTAYQARDPREIRSVFFQAMVERQCRPNC